MKTRTRTKRRKKTMRIMKEAIVSHLVELMLARDAEEVWNKLGSAT